MTELIGKTLSHYRILGEISRAGMGVVYRAHDTTLKRDIAMKVLVPSLVSDPERRKRFVLEARAAASLEHPHIGALYEAGEAEGQTFIAIEAVRRLKNELTREDEAALSQPISRSPEAYDLYLKGTREVSLGGAEAIEAALGFYEEAARLDPGLAAAHVGMGTVQLERYTTGAAGPRSLADAQERFEEALRLDARLQAARGGLIRVHSYRGHVEECLKLGRHVAQIGLDDEESLFVRAEAYFFGGLPDKAIPAFERILEMDPASQGAHWFLVIARSQTLTPDAALRDANRYFDRFGSDPGLGVYLGLAYHRLGRLAEAERHYAAALRQVAGRGAPGIYVFELGGVLQHELGDPETGRWIWQRGADVIATQLETAPDNDRMRCLQAKLIAYLAGETHSTARAGAS